MGGFLVGGGEPPEQAQTLYVAPDGNNNNAGTIDAPLQTINNGLSKLATSGGALYIRAGTYAEALVNAIPSNTTVSNYQDEVVTLVPAVAGQVININSNRTNIVLSGLILDGTHTTDGLKLNDPTNVLVQNCEIKNAPNHGCLMSGGNLILDGCIIHDTGTDQLDHAIYMQTGGLIVRNCEIYNNVGHGIHANSGGDANVYTIENNNIHDNGDFGIGIYYGHATVTGNTCNANAVNMCARYNFVEATFDGNTLTNGVVADIIIGEILHALPVSATVTNNAINSSPIGLWIRDTTPDGLSLTVMDNTYFGNEIDVLNHSNIELP